MLRIISGLLLLIISHVSFADVTVPASSSVSSSPAPLAVEAYFTRASARGDTPLSACTKAASLQVASYNASAYPGYSFSVGSVSAADFRCTFVNLTHVSDGIKTTTTPDTSYYPYALLSSRICPAGSVSDGSNCLTTVYKCDTDGFNLSDASGGSSGDMKYCTLRTSCQSSVVANADGYSLTSGYSGCVNGCSASFVTSPTAQSTLDAGGQVPYSEVKRKTTINGQVAYSGGAISYNGQSCSGSEYVSNSSSPSVPSQEDPSTATLDMTDGASCQFGTSTGSFNGQNVIFCKSSDSSSESESDSDTETGSGGSSGSGSDSESEEAGSGGGTNGGTSGGSSSSDDPDDTPKCDTEDAQADCAGTGSGGSFTEPGKGTDYLKDVFGEADIAALNAKKEDLTAKINLKMADVKSVFNLGSLSVSGSMPENNQEIKGASVDLSAKSLFEKFSIVAAAFYLCAIATAIYIVLGGKK